MSEPRYVRNSKGDLELVGTVETGGSGSGGTAKKSDDALTKDRLQNTSGLASKVKSDAFVPPRAEPGEDSAAYAARVARARAAYNQRKAMK